MFNGSVSQAVQHSSSKDIHRQFVRVIRGDRRHRLASWSHATSAFPVPSTTAHLPFSSLASPISRFCIMTAEFWSSYLCPKWKHAIDIFTIRNSLSFYQNCIRFLFSLFFCFSMSLLIRTALTILLFDFTPFSHFCQKRDAPGYLLSYTFYFTSLLVFLY